MKKIGVIIGAIVGAACAGITVYLLGNPFASAAVGFVWCYTGYFLGKYIEKKKGSNKQEKRWQLQVYQDDDRLETWYFLQQKYNISPLIHINSGKLNFMILIGHADEKLDCVMPSILWGTHKNKYRQHLYC